MRAGFRFSETRYFIMHKRDQVASVADKAVPRLYSTPWANYIGLRENLADAVERRQKIWGGEVLEPVTDATHVGLRVTITSHGVGELVLRRAAPEDSYSSTLYKKVFPSDKKVDWKQWHFVGDLPLEGHPLYDESGYTVAWTPVTSDIDS